MSLHQWVVLGCVLLWAAAAMLVAVHLFLEARRGRRAAAVLKDIRQVQRSVDLGIRQPAGLR